MDHHEYEKARAGYDEFMGCIEAMGDQIMSDMDAEFFALLDAEATKLRKTLNRRKKQRRARTGRR